MKKMMNFALAIGLAMGMVACKQSPGKTIVKKAADAMNKKDYAAFTSLLSAETLTALNKACEPMKAVPKEQVAAFSQASKIPEDVITNCSPAKMMEFGMSQEKGAKEEKFQAEKIKSEVQEGNVINLELDDAQHTKMKLVKEGNDWKIDMSAEFKAKE